MASKSIFILLYTTLLSFTVPAASTSQKVFDVRNYGASGDAKTDNAIAFTNTWKKACKWYGFSTFYIPAGTFYLSQIQFTGPCKSPITFIIKGTLLSPRNPNFIKQDQWIIFQYLQKLTITGGGTLDGQGAYSWPLNDCSKNPNCRKLAINIGFTFVNSSRIDGLRSINSKSGHFNFYAVQDFNLTNVNITAPGDSPNTDGIKIGRSNKMNINYVDIGTGDDCIAILDGTTNLGISNVKCGPGHGISVGSLGKYKEEKSVEGVRVWNTILNGTTDGLRIKTWAKSASKIFVSNFVYDNIEMINVGTPIVIDQQYCPHGVCESEGRSESHVQIRDVVYNNIWGTSASKEIVKMQCSKRFPCQKIRFYKINLKYYRRDGPEIALCENVGGFVRGRLVPAKV